jgi:hypothetical protein
VPFQKREHGLLMLKSEILECLFSARLGKTANERLFKRLGRQIASRTGRLSPVVGAGTGILPCG